MPLPVFAASRLLLQKANKDRPIDEETRRDRPDWRGPVLPAPRPVRELLVEGERGNIEKLRLADEETRTERVGLAWASPKSGAGHLEGHS